LTDLGRAVLDPVRALASWALAQSGRIEAAQRRFDQSEASLPARLEAARQRKTAVLPRKKSAAWR
jgi:hypothetical protein